MQGFHDQETVTKPSRHNPMVKRWLGLADEQESSAFSLQRGLPASPLAPQNLFLITPLFVIIATINPTVAMVHQFFHQRFFRLAILRPLTTYARQAPVPSLRPTSRREDT